MYVTSIARSLTGACHAFVAGREVTSVLAGSRLQSLTPRSNRLLAIVLVLVSLLVVTACFGAFTGAGTVGAATDNLSANDSPAVDEDVAGASPIAHLASASDGVNQPPSPPEDAQLVVRFEDDHVVTGSTADELPPDPEITTESGEPLLIDDHDDYDLRVVQTMDGDVATVDGEPIHKVDADPDLVVFEGETISDELEVDRNTGDVRTVDGGTTVTVNGDDVIYPEHDTIDLTPEITDVDDVDEGETLSVTAEIDNSRWAHASGSTVELRLLESGDRIATVSESVSVDGGEQTTVTLSYETKSGDYVIDELEVAVDGDTDVHPIEIGAAGAAVTITETNAPIEDSDLLVTVEVNRYGDIPSGSHNYPISLFVDGTEEQTQVVSLTPGEVTTRTFSYETDGDDLPEIEAMVTSRTDSDSTTVPVISLEEHEENIGAAIANTSIGTVDDPLTIDASFEYDGEIPYGETEFRANLSVDGTVTDYRNITLDGSAPINETFVHDRDPSDPPVSNVTIETPGESASVVFERDTAIEFTDVTDPAARNESLSATVEVENTGETPGRETLTIEAANPSAVESNATHTFPIQLEPGESTTEDVTFESSDNAPPRLELRANTSTTTETRTIEVRDNEPNFEIVSRSVEGATDPDSDLTVTATVRNTGGVAGTQEATLTFDGETLAAEQLSLDPDEDAVLSGVVDRPEDGTYAYGAATDDDDVSDTTTVSDDGPASADTESGSESESESEPSSRFWDGLSIGFGNLALPLLVASVLGLLLVGAAVIKNREDVPDEIQDRMAALQPAARKLRSAARTLVSNDGSGSVVVQNDLPRTALVRVRVRSGDEILFLEDFELGENERRTLDCLPGGTQFEVGSGVDDIAAHEESFPQGTDEVGVILRPEGITITAL